MTARRNRAQRGYTAVELMIAIGIFGIGVTGVISMEKVTSVSNQHAKNLSIATHIAESWIDMLAVDATVWNYPSKKGTGAPNIGQTTWLQGVKTNANTVNDWFRPAYSAPLSFGPAFDALGNAVDPAANPNDVAFCSHLRLSWLYQPTTTGNGLIRAEVRVFWLRSGQGFAQNPCAVDQVANVGAAQASFHFVQKVSAIRENDQ